MQEDVRKTLEERHKTYGLFSDRAIIAQKIKNSMMSSIKWNKLQPDHKEALEMIANKIGRIINGDPDYLDSWVDISGYATLVADRITGKAHKT